MIGSDGGLGGRWVSLRRFLTPQLTTKMMSATLKARKAEKVGRAGMVIRNRPWRARHPIPDTALYLPCQRTLTHTRGEPRVHHLVNVSNRDLRYRSE